MRIEALNRLAASQHGLFTRRQALDRGWSNKQITGGARAGRWQRVHRGVYRMTGAPITDLQALHAAVLAGGPDSIASHRGAAWLWDLLADMYCEISSPGGHPKVGIVAHRLVDDVRIVVRRGVPCTDALHTVVDLAAVGDEKLLVQALDRGIATGLFPASAVASELRRRATHGVPGVALLRACLQDRLDHDARRTSALESAMDRLIRRHGLPRPERQFAVAAGPYRLDYAWSAARLAVELDGYAHHSALDAFRQDRRRQNDLVLAGWTVLRFTYDDVLRRPAQVAGQIALALTEARVPLVRSRDSSRPRARSVRTSTETP